MTQMKEDEIQGAVKAAIEAAIDYVDSDIRGDR